MEKVAQLLELNPEQSEIVRSEARRIAVSAGAGTGKTRLLVARCLVELESGKSGIDSIVAITFTENAAAEIRERLGAGIGAYIKEFGECGNLNTDTLAKISTAQISTIHGLAARIMKENLFDTNWTGGFKIAQQSATEEILERSVLETVLKLRTGSGAASEALDELLKNELFNLDTVLKNIAHIIRETAQKHLRPPLLSPDLAPGNGHPPGAESLLKMFEENEKVFSTTYARKRFEKAAEKINPSAPDGFLCLNFKEAAREMEAVADMKKASVGEKQAAEKMAAHATAAADFLNAKLTGLYIPVVEEALKQCEKLKIQNSAIEYEDLLINATGILRKNHSVRGRYRERFGLIMVDEFQDTDSLQYELIELLYGEKGKLIVVGDMLQSIYGFRGAEPGLFRDILASPEFEKFRLPTNYRTSSKLTDFLNGFFENIFDDYKPMKAGRESAGVFETFPAEGNSAEETRANEAAHIAEKISALTKTGGYSLSDIALIFRRSSNIKIYEKALRRACLPFKRTGGTGFFGLAEIRDIVSMMKFIINPLDEKAEAAVLRSPFFGISDTGLMRYFSEKKKRQTPSYNGFLKMLSRGGGKEHEQAARYLLSIVEKRKKINISSPLQTARFAAYDLGYAAGALALDNGRQIRSNIMKFVEICAQFTWEGTGLPEAVSRFEAAKNSGGSAAVDEPGNSVSLMTSHASKGLEFPVVFLADTNYAPVANRGNIAVGTGRGVMVCHDRCGIGIWKEIAESGSEEEEKRILYVTMTRAGDMILTRRHTGISNHSSLAGIIESGLKQMPGFEGKAGETPAIRGKTVEGKEKRHRDGKDRVTAESLRPLYEEEETGESPGRFCTTTKAEEGEIIHRFFEIWDFSPESIESVAKFVATESFESAKSVQGSVRQCAENALKSPLAEMVRKAKNLWKEYEFTIENDRADGREIRNGKVDLLLETDKGKVIVDYKYTDSFELEKYAEQIDFYCKAIEKIHGEKPVERYICVLPSAELKNV